MNETLPPLPDDVAALLKRAARPQLPPELSAQVWDRLASTAVASSVAAGSVGAGLAVKLSIAALLAGAVGGATIGHQLWPAPAPPPVERVVVKEVRVEVPATAAVKPPPIEAAPIPGRRARAERVDPAEPARPTRDAALAEERTILEIARTALARGDETTALARFEDHSKRFPHGQLAEEREALWVRALLASGRKEEAGAKAKAFFLAFPDSLLAPGLKDAAALP